MTLTQALNHANASLALAAQIRRSLATPESLWRRPTRFNRFTI